MSCIAALRIEGPPGAVCRLTTTRTNLPHWLAPRGGSSGFSGAAIGSMQGTELPRLWKGLGLPRPNLPFRRGAGSPSADVGQPAIAVPLWQRPPVAGQAQLQISFRNRERNFAVILWLSCLPENSARNT